MRILWSLVFYVAGWVLFAPDEPGYDFVLGLAMGAGILGFAFGEVDNG